MVAVRKLTCFRIPGPRPEVQVGQAGGVLQSLQATDASVPRINSPEIGQFILANGFIRVEPKLLGDYSAQVFIRYSYCIGIGGLLQLSLIEFTYDVSTLSE